MTVAESMKNRERSKKYTEAVEKFLKKSKFKKAVQKHIDKLCELEGISNKLFHCEYHDEIERIIIDYSTHIYNKLCDRCDYGEIDELINHIPKDGATVFEGIIKHGKILRKAELPNYNKKLLSEHVSEEDLKYMSPRDIDEFVRLYNRFFLHYVIDDDSPFINIEDEAKEYVFIVEE